MADKDIKYVPQAIGIQGGWNPDSALELIGENEFSEVRNLRQNTLGEYEIRSNYKDYAALTAGAVGNASKVLCALEYKYVDSLGAVTSFDVTFYHDGANIKALGLNRSKIAGSTYWAAQFSKRILRNDTDTADLLIATSLTDPIKAFAVQYGSDISLTVYGLGVYVIYPIPATNLADKWVVRQIGKDRATMPETSFPVFADTYNGDLFLVLYNDNAASEPNPVLKIAHHTIAKPLDAGQKPESIFPAVQFIPIPIGCKYFHSKNSAFDAGTELRFWEFSKDDPPVNGRSARSAGHLQERGWIYRTVFVHKYTDSRGNKTTWRSLASVDFSVSNEIYCPPQVFSKDTNLIHNRQQQFRNSPVTIPNLGAPNTPTTFAFSDSYSAQLEDPTIPYPSAADVRALGESIIAYNGKSWTYDAAHTGETGMQESIWLGAMYWIGFWRRHEGNGPGNLFHFLEEFNFDGDYKCPYFCEVTANDLASAPLTKFKWSQFTSVPADVTEIEIYRTAFSGSDKTVTLNGQVQPLYQPHLLGYIGSLKRPDGADDPEFLDDIADEDIDFGNDASQHDGLIAGNFSGAVMEEYNTHIAILDIITRYSVDHPWDLYQIFVWSNSTSDVGVVADITAGTKFFELQYIDADGNISVGQKIGSVVGPNPIISVNSPPGNTKWGNVTAVMPAGYDPFITGIRLLYFDGANFRLVKTVKPDDKFVTATFAQCNGGEVLANDQGTGIVTTADQGGLIWSNPADIYTFAPLNYKLIHPSAPGTALKSILGELFVWSDRSVALTNLAGRYEEENKDVGAIGRFVTVKVDEIVFFLSASGLFYADASGVKEIGKIVKKAVISSGVDKLIRTYLNERIIGVTDLTNARRASLGYLAKQKELWLYLPGSDDITDGGANHGSLIPVLIILKITPEGLLPYKFTLLATDGGAGTLGYNIGYTGTNGVYVAGIQSLYQPMIFTPHSDGKLFCVYKNETDHLIHTLDNDNMTDGDFAGDTFLEHPFSMGAGMIAKILRSIRIIGDFTGKLFVRHGAPRPDGIANYTTGIVNPTSTEYEYTIPASGQNAAMNHRVGGLSSRVMAGEEIQSSTSYVPVVRWRSSKSGGVHTVHYKGIITWLKELHNHPS